MNIAITYENGEIFQHFGHSKEIKLYEVEKGKIISSKIIDVSISGHNELIDLLKSNEVKVLICGGIGECAKTALKDANITLFYGICGNADDAINKYLKGNLNSSDTIICNHGNEKHNHCKNHESCNR